jgi:hypothetical protein
MDWVPAAAGATVMVGNGVIARLDPWGQDSINPAARVNTERTPSGVSNADGIALTLLAVRMKV